MKLGIGNVVAIIGFVGIGIASAAGAPGCTATLTTSSCDGGNCGSGTVPPGNTDNDSAAPIDQDSSSQGDTGSTPFDACNACLYDQCVGAYSNCIANAS